MFGNRVTYMLENKEKKKQKRTYGMVTKPIGKLFSFPTFQYYFWFKRQED